MCIGCQEMPAWMEVAMDERVSGEEVLRLPQFVGHDHSRHILQTSRRLKNRLAAVASRRS